MKDNINVYDCIQSESLSSLEVQGKTPKEKVDWYLSNAITIIENDNPIYISDIKLLINYARKELKNIKEE